ncbi:MAG: TorF family putative porin [Methylophilaceae bacterium]|nr:TorF family putative porin [Methyloradius sp.]
MRKSLLAVAVLGTLSFSAASFAADEAAAPAPDYTVTTNVGIFSDYIFRGLSQTAGKPALQGGIDWTHSSGLYLGAWGSNQSWLADAGASTGAGAYRNSSIELDVYGGYRSTIGDTGLSYDVGAIYVAYPGTRTSAAVIKADTAEVYGALTYSILTFKVNYALTDFYGVPNSGEFYFDLTANYPVPTEWTGISGISAVAHVGRQKVNADPALALDYTDYKLGLAKAWDNGVSLGGYFTSTTASDTGYGNNFYSYKNTGSNALTGYLTKTF